MRLVAAAWAGLAATVLAADPPRLRRSWPASSSRAPTCAPCRADAFANPGLLWVERGAALWSAARGEARSRAPATATRAIDEGRVGALPGARPPGRVVDIEQRINACVVENQRAAALAMESEEMLALSRSSRASRATCRWPSIDARSAETLRARAAESISGARASSTSPAQCHDASWGKTLLAEKISQGHPADWPAYASSNGRSTGSLGRRLRMLFRRARGNADYGSSDMVALELYLARRATGLVSDAPGVRR